MNKALLLVALACALQLVPLTASARDVMRVGVAVNNKPWEFEDPSGQLVGFDVDMVKAIGARLNMQLTFFPMPFGNLFAAVGDGRIDVAASAITISTERAGRFDFSQPYYRTSQGIATIKGSDIRGVSDLAGKKVAAEAGSINEQWLEANRARYGLGPTIPTQGIEQAMKLLETGEVDAYFCDLPAMLYQLLTRPDLAVVARLTSDDDYALLLAKGSPLTVRVDDALSAIKRDGTMAQIHQKWFGGHPEPGSPVIDVMKRP